MTLHFLTPLHSDPKNSNKFKKNIIEVVGGTATLAPAADASVSSQKEVASMLVLDAEGKSKPADKNPPSVRPGGLGAGGCQADTRGLPDHPSDLHKVKTLKKSKKE